MVTLSSVLTSMSKPFFIVRRETVAALRSTKGILAWKPRHDTMELAQALDDDGVLLLDHEEQIAGDDADD